MSNRLVSFNELGKTREEVHLERKFINSVLDVLRTRP